MSRPPNNRPPELDLQTSFSFLLSNNQRRNGQGKGEEKGEKEVAKGKKNEKSEIKENAEEAVAKKQEKELKRRKINAVGICAVHLFAFLFKLAKSF